MKGVITSLRNECTDKLAAKYVGILKSEIINYSKKRRLMMAIMSNLAYLLDSWTCGGPEMDHVLLKNFYSSITLITEQTTCC